MGCNEKRGGKGRGVGGDIEIKRYRLGKLPPWQEKREPIKHPTIGPAPLRTELNMNYVEAPACGDLLMFNFKFECDVSFVK